MPSLIVYHDVYNKKTWGDGPWLTEPDKVQWIDEATGYDCLAVRVGTVTGAWCGYVGVPENHPWHGLSYSNWDEEGGRELSPEDLIEVHGGITYSDMCAEGMDEAKGVCHVPEKGAAKNPWWFGFDCAHAFDLCPQMKATMEEIYAKKGEAPPRSLRDGETYRTLDYVREQVTSMAKQLKEHSWSR